MTLLISRDGLGTGPCYLSFGSACHHGSRLVRYKADGCTEIEISSSGCPIVQLPKHSNRLAEEDRRQDRRGWVHFPHSIWLVLAILTLSFITQQSLVAQEQTISQMVHTSWTGRDGAPQGINALAQTPDGNLWIGTFVGLYSFDGLKFQVFNPKPGSSPLAALIATANIAFLFVSKDGDLWSFPYNGPAARIRDGDVRFYGDVRGEDLHTLSYPQQDSSGTLWSILNQGHLVRLGSDGIWEQLADPAAGVGDIAALLIDSTDTVWIVDNKHLYRKPKEASEFIRTGVDVYGPVRITEGRDHTIWVAEVEAAPFPAVNLQHVSQDGHKLFAPPVHGPITELLSAHDGSLWITEVDRLQRLTAEETAAGHSQLDRLSPDLFPSGKASQGIESETLLSDFDGNIWVGGTSGLNRFEHANLSPALPGSKIGSWRSCVDRRGEVWIASVNGNVQLISIKNGHASTIQSGLGGVNLFCGDDGQLYLLGDRGISALRNGRIQRLPLLPGIGAYLNGYEFLGLVAEPSGDLIAAVGGPAGHGLWKYNAGKWSRFLPNLALPTICGMVEDSSGQLFVAFANSRDEVGRISGESLTMVPGMGALNFARTPSYGIVAYGRRGVAINRGDHFQRLLFAHPEQGSVITGVVESRNGDLWINGAKGIARVPAVEIRTAMADPLRTVASFNVQEGDFVGPDVPIFFRSSADIDPAGRLWFSTLNGVVSVDPDRLSMPRHPPQLTIRSITADGRPLNTKGTLPPGIQYLDIRYFGVDLTRPQDVVYRYRLQGLDADWQNVGARAEAIYTHVRPGSYAFQVMASSGDDLWSSPVSSVKFTVLPHFYEMRWFQGLCILAAALLIWIGICARLRHASAAIRIRAEERAEERVRIARELHDTLLQGIQGLLLSFHSAAAKVPAEHESKEALDRALMSADRIILEGRDRVNRLRSEHLMNGELETSIRELAGDLASLSKMAFELERTGTQRRLDPEVMDELYFITREALTNAYRHSGGSQVIVALDYEKERFRLECRDNGRGFSTQGLADLETKGHWGLRGMSERAERIGADLTFESATGKGVHITVNVPAVRAYVRTVGFRLFFRRPASN
jgi:signal transduction histidine kinase/ligand-binding sensor domain-containing protein